MEIDSPSTQDLSSPPHIPSPRLDPKTSHLPFSALLYTLPPSGSIKNPPWFHSAYLPPPPPGGLDAVLGRGMVVGLS